MASSVPGITWTSSGPSLPTEADILAGVQDDNNAAFGGNLNPSLETPQGQLASSQTAVIADKNSQLAYLAAQFDPNQASGRFQDALGKIYFLTRIAAAGTIVQAACSGLNGTVIPVGAKAIDTNGYIYSCTTSGAIDSTGSVTLPFTCTTTGAIACPAGALNAIYQGVSGWDSVNNAADGVLGRDVESRYEFEQRRKLSVALNSTGSPQAIRANVLAVSGVLSAYVIDNPTNTSTAVGAVTLPANSIYVAVVGGTSADIANAIWTKKDAGCSYYAGNTSYTIYDTNGYQIPYPQYTITWETPAATPILFAIQIQANPLLPSNINTLIQNAIISAAAGGDGGAPFAIGATIYSGRFWSVVAGADPNCSPVSILIGTVTATATSQAIEINQIPTVSATDISVTQV